MWNNQTERATILLEDLYRSTGLIVDSTAGIVVLDDSGVICKLEWDAGEKRYQPIPIQGQVI